jgi:hypothetical protein
MLSDYAFSGEAGSALASWLHAQGDFEVLLLHPGYLPISDRCFEKLSCAMVLGRHRQRLGKIDRFVSALRGLNRRVSLVGRRIRCVFLE